LALIQHQIARTIDKIPYGAVDRNNTRPNAMSIYETSATVEDQGRLFIDGVPFAPGTQVAVTISPKASSEGSITSGDDEHLAAARDRMRELFRTIKGFRNSPRIPREELYERGRAY
jgi:hypothetical protein